MSLTGGLVLLAGVGMAVATWAQARSGEIICSSARSAGDLFDDLPPVGREWLRPSSVAARRPHRIAVGVAMTLFIGHAERSLIEGLERGIPEGLAAAAGFLVFGRAIGAFRAAPRDDAGDPA